MSATTYQSTVANAVIDAIRVQVAVRKDVLDAAKRRRDRVRELAHEHDAARATFNSGSVAHGTANAPLSDTDCGVVLDRRKFWDYGLDGGNLPPRPMMESFRDWILPRLRREYHAGQLRDHQARPAVRVPRDARVRRRPADRPERRSHRRARAPRRRRSVDPQYRAPGLGICLSRSRIASRWSLLLESLVTSSMRSLISSGRSARNSAAHSDHGSGSPSMIKWVRAVLENRLRRRARGQRPFASVQESGATRLTPRLAVGEDGPAGGAHGGSQPPGPRGVT
jgi:hypothetical protein